VQYVTVFSFVFQWILAVTTIILQNIQKKKGYGHKIRKEVCQVIRIIVES